MPSRSSPEEAIAWYEQELAEEATGLEAFEAPVLESKLRKNPEELIAKINNAEDAKVLEESLSTLQASPKTSQTTVECSLSSIHLWLTIQRATNNTRPPSPKTSLLPIAPTSLVA